MLVEKNISDAMKAYDKGKKVLVLTTMMDGSISCDKLEDLFPEGTHSLVDIPAVANPEFAAAVQRMVQAAPAEQVKKDDVEKDEDNTPPPPSKNEKVDSKRRGGRKAVGFDIELLKVYANEGMTYREMAAILGADTSTVQKRCKKEGIVPNKEARKVKKENSRGIVSMYNSDRHLCKTCMYRHSDAGGCDYICYTGHARGCKAEECTEYKEGNPRR